MAVVQFIVCLRYPGHEGVNCSVVREGGHGIVPAIEYVLLALAVVDAGRHPSAPALVFVEHPLDSFQQRRALALDVLYLLLAALDQVVITRAFLAEDVLDGPQVVLRLHQKGWHANLIDKVLEEEALPLFIRVIVDAGLINRILVDVRKKHQVLDLRAESVGLRPGVLVVDKCARVRNC